MLSVLVINNGIILQWFHPNESYSVGGYKEKTITCTKCIATTTANGAAFVGTSSLGGTVHDIVQTLTQVTYVLRNQYEGTSTNTNFQQVFCIGY